MKKILIYQNKEKGILIEKDLSKNATNNRWILTLYKPSTNKLFFGNYIETKFYKTQNELKKDNKILFKNLF